jgi:hypothetical protein
MVVFQYQDSTQAEKDLFDKLASFRWKRELYHIAAYDQFVAEATGFAYDHVFHQDLHVANQVAALKRSHKAELDALKGTSSDRNKKQQKEPVDPIAALEHQHANRVVATVLDNIIDDAIAHAKQNEREQNERRVEAERVANLDAARAWIGANVVQDGTLCLAKKDLYGAYQKTTQKPIMYKDFGELGKDILGLPRKRVVIDEAKRRNVWVGWRLVN